MSQSIDEILDDLRSFVGGRGREDNFLFSKVYAPTSYVLCMDFSPWIGMRLTKNDTLALAVFYAQLYKRNNQFEEVTRFNLADDKDELVGEEIIEEVNNSPAAFKREVNRYEQEIKQTLLFSFEVYFVNDIRLAKLDLWVAWLLKYSGEAFAMAMMPYRLMLKKANIYLTGYNQRKKKQLQLPADLPNDPKSTEFLHELVKLPLGSRRHVFKIFEYIGNSRSQKPIILSNAQLAGIDTKASANILRQSKLIKSFSDGTGIISPEFVAPIATANDYAKKIAPVYDEWKTEVALLISEQLGVYFYGKDPKDDGY
jgi:hypothetical protein